MNRLESKFLCIFLLFVIPLCLEGKFSVKRKAPISSAQFLRDGRFGVYHYDITAMKGREVQFSVHPMILARRSLREMNGLPVDRTVLMSLFEASRWAPSYYNTQSWRYVFATRDGPYWNQFVDALVPGNQKWAQHAGALIVVLSNKYQIHNGEKKPVASHTFDTGASWMAMALEGTARGLVVHPMSGYDKEKVRKMIGLKNDDYQIEAMIAVGNRVRLVSNEKITQRHPIEKFVSEGTFEEKIFV